jgi:hypothetical protein
MTDIKFEITDDDFRKIETHKWNIRDWERIEKTFSYLRKKYGQPRVPKVAIPSEDSSWVQE